MAVQFVDWLLPSSRYFHTAPVEIKELWAKAGAEPANRATSINIGQMKQEGSFFMKRRVFTVLGSVEGG
jgi:hypothetical protein